jgi:cytochrome c oxidase subunit 2
VFGEQREGLRRVTTRRRLAASLLLLVAVALVTAACGDTAIPQNSLDPATPQARDIDNLFTLVFWIAVVIFVLVEAGLLFAVWRFRRRSGPEREVKQVHGNLRLEVIWTIIPTVVLAVIAVPTLRTIFELRTEPAPEENALEINVIGHQWWWEFEYPEYGFATAQEMYVPTGRTVYLHITSADVIHSFWTPRLQGKRDAVPGRVNNLTFLVEEEGDYLGQCAEFCGLAHADMRHVVKAVSPEDFEAWAQRHATPLEMPVDGAALQGYETFQQVCAACHVIDGSVGAQPEVTAPLDGRETWSLAPNLTYFAEREKFGGWSFDNDEVHLAEWLANPSDLKPMDPDRNDLETGRILGMPNFGLTQAQIDGLVAFLNTLR